MKTELSLDITVEAPIWKNNNIWVNAGEYKGREFDKTRNLIRINERTVTLVDKKACKELTNV